MAEYVIQRKEKCDRCYIGCRDCTKGYIVTEENLLDVLRKLRWSKPFGFGTMTDSIFSDDLRIEE